MKLRWILSYAVLFLIFISYVSSSSPSYTTEENCRRCHSITVDRHHLLVPDGMYQCTDCHMMQYDSLNQEYYPEVIRNCLICHAGTDHTDAHHLLLVEGLFVCSDCHPMKYDAQNQTYYPEILWDCTVCHSTVSDPGSPLPPSIPEPLNPPSMLNFYPLSPVQDITGASRTFNITVDQGADVSWYINGNLAQSNGTVSEARYTNDSAAAGTWDVSAIAANDNGSVRYTWRWKVMYDFNGFLAPIKNDDSSVFRLGSKVPIRFQLHDANGDDITDAIVRLSITRMTSTTTRTYSEPYVTETEPTDDVFIFTTSHMYRYNLATRNMSNATWQIRLDIDDGTSKTVNISLKS
ncbi:MAG: PxKF domain-containing protein [ANME-2 cluster archaeon]|nr:PxKF domain-containing protein [ANME-2 cluster archaeon]